MPKDPGLRPDVWDVWHAWDKEQIDLWDASDVRFRLRGEAGIPLTPDTRAYLLERLPFLVLAEAAGPPKEK